MVRRSRIILAALFLFTAPIRGEDLDDEAVAMALKAGIDDRFGSWTADCRAEASRSEKRAASGLIRRTGSYDVVVSTNLGAVALVAHQAKERGQTLGVSDVPAWSLNASVYVFVEPRKPPRDWGGTSSARIPMLEVPSSIAHVAISSKVTPIAPRMEPETFVTADASFSESGWLESQLPYQFGPDGRPRSMVFKNSRARVTFSIESLEALPGGDVDIVIVTYDGERRCSIRARDRVRLFPKRPPIRG